MEIKIQEKENKVSTYVNNTLWDSMTTPEKKHVANKLYQKIISQDYLSELLIFDLLIHIEGETDIVRCKDTGTETERYTI